MLQRQRHKINANKKMMREDLLFSRNLILFLVLLPAVDTNRTTALHYCYCFFCLLSLHCTNKQSTQTEQSTGVAVKTKFLTFFHLVGSAEYETNQTNKSWFTNTTRDIKEEINVQKYYNLRTVENLLLAGKEVTELKGERKESGNKV